MLYHRLHVDGMTCRGCEAVIKREITATVDSTDVTADHEAGVVEFASESTAAGGYVEQAINDLGYDVTEYESE